MHERFPEPKELNLPIIERFTNTLIKENNTRRLAEWIGYVSSHENQELSERVAHLVRKVPFPNPRTSLE